MTNPTDTLARLRRTLDLIDDQILALLERRIETARAIGAAKPGTAGILKLRPAREAAVIARLEAKAAPAACSAVRPVWRELMAHCLQAQAPMPLVLAGGDVRICLLAREAFGSAPDIEIVASATEAIARAQAGDAIALLPLPLPILPPGLVAFRTVGEGAAAVGRIAAEDVEERDSWSPASWGPRHAMQMPLSPHSREARAA